MTFSICVHEAYETDDGDTHHRYGVAVTTRLPAVGTLCPFVSDQGAVATQSLVNVDLGRKGLQYLADGLAVSDALESLLNADEGAPQRQLHGVDDEGTFAFSGAECVDWFGHEEYDHFTVAGNMLTGPDVLETTADAYAESAVHETEDPWTGPRSVDPDLEPETDPLAKRLIDALAAGHRVGGDKRDELPIQSAAVVVASTESHVLDPLYADLRIDASETPIEDLIATYDRAVEGYTDTLAQYEGAFEDDSLADADDLE